MSNGTLSTQRTLSHFFSESWISKVLDIIDFSKSSLFIHFRRTSESAWMKMHLLCSDEKAWSQRPLDGVRAGQRNGHIFFYFWAVLGTRTQCGYEEFTINDLNLYSLQVTTLAMHRYVEPYFGKWRVLHRDMTLIHGPGLYKSNWGGDAAF